ncbi:MAG TPA: GDSL-type esterase/lipase family protein [Candidatus Limnocylindrales bacterium]
MSSPDEDPKIQSRHDIGGVAQPRIMAHPEPRLAQSNRYMAHPVRFGRARRAWDSTTSRFGGTVGGSLKRVLPAEQRHRDLAVVVVFILIASAVAASVPGGWAGAASAGHSSPLIADAGSSSDSAASGESIQPVATTTDLPMLPAGPWAPTHPPTPTPKPTPAPTRTPHDYSFVALGDSLTAWPASGTWPSRLDSMDANLHMVSNAGVPGNVTSQMLARENSDVFSLKPEVMFLLGGTNDVGQHISQATTIANLRSIIVNARAKKITVFMMTIPPNSYSGMAAEIDSMNAAIIHLANSYKIVYIDIHAVLSTTTGVYISKYTSDGLHFSDLGAQAVATAVYSRIHRLGY